MRAKLFVELSFQSIPVPVLPRDREDMGALVLVPLQDGRVAMAGELGADSTILLLIFGNGPLLGQLLCSSAKALEHKLGHSQHGDNVIEGVLADIEDVADEVVINFEVDVGRSAIIIDSVCDGNALRLEGADLTFVDQQGDIGHVLCAHEGDSGAHAADDVDEVLHIIDIIFKVDFHNASFLGQFTTHAGYYWPPT